MLKLNQYLIWRKKLWNRIPTWFPFYLTENFVKSNTKTSSVFDLTEKFVKLNFATWLVPFDLTENVNMNTTHRFSRLRRTLGKFPIKDSGQVFSKLYKCTNLKSLFLIPLEINFGLGMFIFREHLFWNLSLLKQDGLTEIRCWVTKIAKLKMVLSTNSYCIQT